MRLLAELKRRNVFRMVGLYLVGAWLIIQIAETLLPIFHTPDWVLQALVVVLAIGFIPALIFSWIFELTPDGLKRESDVDRQQSIVDHTARKLDIAVILLLLLVGSMLVWQSWRGAPEAMAPPAIQGAATTDSEAEPAAGTELITDKSIAVLPFADFSQGGDQGWFADGLAEEILNSLARTPDLLVSARTSSFKYKGSDLAIPEIAAELRVAHVLEGSVRSSPGRVRVTAQLIRAADGFHLWSQTYDRDVADMIEVQEDLARQIAIAMQTRMDPAALADMARVGTQSVEAYQAYIRGVAKNAALGPAEYKQAYEFFERAREIDPSFSAAHGKAADFWLELLDPTSTMLSASTDNPAHMGRQFNERIDLAIAHASTDIDSLRLRALKAMRELRLREANELFRAFLIERPSDPATINYLLDGAAAASDQALLRETLDRTWPLAQTNPEIANTHLNAAHRAEDRHLAAEQALVLLERWSEQPIILYQIHRALLWDRRIDAAATVLTRWQATGPDDNWAAIPPARQACAEGRPAEVEAALASTAPDNLSQRWHLLILLNRAGEAAEVLQSLEQAGNTFALAKFLVYPQFDPAPYPSLMRVLVREKIDRPAPILPPFACPSIKDGP